MIDRRTNSSRRQNVKLVLASLAVLSACAHPNRPVSPIESDTLAYSSAISDARQEQLLMNIVRLRYNDPVTFVDAERITTTENTQINGMLASALALGGQNLDRLFGVEGVGLCPTDPAAIAAGDHLPDEPVGLERRTVDVVLRLPNW